MRNTAEVRGTIDADNSFMSEAVVMDANVAFEGQHQAQLEPSTQDELHDVIINSPPKSRAHDPLSTYLLK